MCIRDRTFIAIWVCASAQSSARATDIGASKTGASKTSARKNPRCIVSLHRIELEVRGPVPTVQPVSERAYLATSRGLLGLPWASLGFLDNDLALRFIRKTHPEGRPGEPAAFRQGEHVSA